MIAPLLAVEDLCVDRGGVRVLEEISFALQPGETLGIVGESGSGKSTLARAVLRLLQPARGKVRWRGRDLLALDERELREVRREMQIVFQDPATSLDPRMTVSTAVAEPLAVHRLGHRSERGEKVLELLSEEVPHSIAVVVDEIEPGDSPDILLVTASIYVERDSQKGIVIGKGGRMLKEIGTRARPDVEELLGHRVFLDLRVKVEPNWPRREALLERFGY